MTTASFLKPRRRPRLAWLAVVLLPILFAAGYLFWPERANLAAYESLGEKYDVRILRDRWGVPHVFGRTDPDAAFGLAYAHAEDDFLTIQQILLAARGQLASVYGKDAAANDYMVGLLRIWDEVDSRYEIDLDPDSRAVMEAYADGINYYASKHPDEVLSPQAFPVTGKDLAAGSVHKSPLFFGLETTLASLFAETRQGELSRRPETSSFPTAFDAQYGSNTLAVGPGRTADGSTFLAVNSHQPWEGPTTWYEAHVRSDEGWDTAGALFPGTPVIIHGHNRELGWAFTVNKADLADVYVLEIDPDDPFRYRFDGEWRQLEVRQVAIPVRILGRLVWTVKREALWSVYGPVVRQSHGTYALRYAGFGRVDIFQQLYRMNKASTFEEWQLAMKEGGLPTFNVGYADREGNIYYLYNAMLPIRAEGYEWNKYLPGDTSETLWREYLPFDELPQVLNPPANFIQNANSTPYQTTLGEGNPNPANYPASFGIEATMTNRALRALELLGGDPSITFEEFFAYKFDQTYSSESDIARFVDMLVNDLRAPDPDVALAQEVLRGWDLTAAPDQAGMTLMAFTLQYLQQDGVLVRSSALVGNQVSQVQLETAFVQAVKRIKAVFGRIDVPWEQANRLVRGGANLGLGGGPDLLNAVYGKMGEAGPLTGYQGDSYVMLVDWDPDGTVHSFSIHQYGSATLDTSSPHYADQAELFVRGELKPVWLDETDIRANLEREYRP